MINASRFSTYSKTQNLGLANISTIKDSEVLNTVTNKLQEVTKDLQSTANSLIQGVLPEGVDIGEVQGLIDTGIRSVKDTFSTIRDLSNFSISDIEKEIASFLPNDPTMQNAFRNLTASCRNNAMSKSSGFKPFSDNMSCGNPGDGRCQSGEVSNFFNKLTDGVIGVISRTLQSMLKALITLGNLGYSGSLCKIFAALANGMPSSVVQRGAAALLATVGGAGNTTAVLDIVAGMGSAIPSLEIPGLVTRIAENFSIPTNYTSGSFTNLFSGYMDALDMIQPGFTDTAITGVSTIASLGSKNSSLMSVASEYIKSNVITDFDSPVGDSSLDVALAYNSKDYGSPLSDLW